jgi:hypothetical protein
MTEPEKHPRETGQPDASEPREPTDTAHPAGEKQATENADNEPAG